MRFAWDHIPNLDTPRLCLRELTHDDRQDLFAIYGDPEVMQFASDPAFPDLSFVEQMLTSVATLFQQQQSLEWGVTLRAEPGVVGTCGLHAFETATQAAEIGCLLRRSHWGQSIMREALTAVITFGFTNLDLALIHADIDAPNTRSLQLFRRLGFSPNQAEPPLYTLDRAAWSGRTPDTI